MRGIRRIKDMKQTQELARGITGVLTDLIVRGKPESAYEFRGNDATVEVKGYWKHISFQEGELWKEGDVMCLEVQGLKRPKAEGDS